MNSHSIYLDGVALLLLPKQTNNRKKEQEYFQSWFKQDNVVSAGSIVASYGNPRNDDSNWVVIFL